MRDTEQAVSRLRVAYSYCERFAKFKRSDSLFDPAEFNDASDALALAAKLADEALEADPYAGLPVEDMYGKRELSIDDVAAEISLLQGILFTNPKNASEFIAMGRQALERSTARRPLPLAYLKLAEMFVLQDRREEAIVAVENGLEIFPADLDLRQLHNRLGRDPALGLPPPHAPAPFPWFAACFGIAGLVLVMVGLVIGRDQTASAALIITSGLCLVIFAIWRWRSGRAEARP